MESQSQFSSVLEPWPRELRFHAIAVSKAKRLLYFNVLTINTYNEKRDSMFLGMLNSNLRFASKILDEYYKVISQNK